MDASANLDTLTGLPWANALRQPLTAWSGQGGVQAIHIRLDGLNRLTEIHSDLVAQTAFRHVARRVTRLLCGRDLCTRLDDNSLLVFTMRTADEVGQLVTAIRREVVEAALTAEGQAVPRVHVHVAEGPEALTAVLSGSEGEGPGTTEPAPVMPAAVSRPDSRVILRSLTVTILGDGVTVTCALSLGDSDVAATSVGPSTDATRLGIIGNATAQALSRLLPAGHSLVVRTVELIGRGQEEGVYTVLDLLAGEERSTLFGVAAANNGVYSAVARSILNATNRKLPVLWSVDVPV